MPLPSPSRLIDVPAGPSRSILNITKSDDDLVTPIRALDVLDGGTVKLTCGDDTVITTPSLPAGYRINCVIKRVWASSGASSFIGYI